MLDMFPKGTAFRTDRAEHASEPVAATWSTQAIYLTGSIVKLKSHCVIKGQYPLRRKASQTTELPCLRASRTFCHVSASSGSQVLSALTSGGRMHLQHVQYTSGVYRLCEGKAGWCKADEDALEPRAMCAGSVQCCVSKQQFHFSVIFSHRAHC